MSDHPESTGAGHAERPMGRTYLGVVVVEALVLLALWLVGRYFRA
jgi:hypothetical protein